MKHGLKGIGAYWCIIEMLAEEDGYLMQSECERIAYELRTDSEFINSIIRDFDLFEFDDDRFYSESLLRRLEVKYEKSKKAKEAAELRWQRYRKRKVMQTHSERNADAVDSQSKRNAIKLNETKQNETKEELPAKIKNFDDAKEVADYLLKAICDTDPTHRFNHNNPSLNSWVKDIDKAIRLDGRDKNGMMHMIRFIFYENCKSANWWQGKIESGKKLREKFDTIKNQILKERQNGTQINEEKFDTSFIDEIPDEFYDH